MGFTKEIIKEGNGLTPIKVLLIRKLKKKKKNRDKQQKHIVLDMQNFQIKT